LDRLITLYIVIMEFRLKIDDPNRRYREYEVAGDVSIQNIEALVEAMGDCVSECDELSISLVGITDFDVAAFQFFMSLKNSFVRDKKKMTVVCDLSPEVAQLLANCGIGDLGATLSIAAA